MATQRPLPDALGESFAVSSAAAAGVSRWRLRGRDLEAPFRGVRMRHDDAPEGPVSGETDPLPHDPRIERLARAYRHRMREGEFFSHSTAAALWGIPLPRRDDSRIDVSVLGPYRAPKSRAVSGHQAPAHLVQVTTLNGLPLTAPASTWAQLASQGFDRNDLIAAGDYVVRIPRTPGNFASAERAEPLATIADLQRAVDAGRRIGVGLLREAIPHIRTDSWSRPETLTRLALIDGGLPEPELNLDVVDEDGRFIACLDLAFERYKVGVEYDGAQHWQSATQYAHDVDRLALLAEAGWLIVHANSRLLFRFPDELVRRTRVALKSRGFRG